MIAMLADFLEVYSILLAHYDLKSSMGHTQFWFILNSFLGVILDS